MNTRPPVESTSPTAVLSIAFNDDCSCFSIGLNSGFCVFNSDTCSLKSVRDFNGGVGLVQMLGRSNFVALVGGGKQPKFAQNKVLIWDDSKAKVGLEITTFTAVRNVQLSRNRVVVVLQNSVRVYAFAKPPNLISAYETADNLLGLCSLAEKTIAFPGRTTGQVQLVDIGTGNVSIIPAHSSALKAIKFSPDGELLATASDTGTLVRIWATSNCARLIELRRGVDPATIFSLAFNPSGTLLASTSDKSTLHVFEVPHPKHPKKQSPSSRDQQNSPQQNHQRAASYVPPGYVDDGKGKWGILGKIPLMPRLFSDVYSIASAPFELGDETLIGGLDAAQGATLGTARPPKGVVGWVDEDHLLVIGAGKDARYEKFVLAVDDEGRRFLHREGWKRYITP